MARVEAVIIAGGLGTRLLPLTKSQPKHLLAVAGVPFVAHQLAKLAAAGIRRVVLATSYHADRFQPVLGDGRNWGVEIVYVTEVEPLGTGGAIRHVLPQLRSADADPVVVVNGDILSGHDLQRQRARHDSTGADVTLHLVEVADARAFGCVATDDGGFVTAFVEKSDDPVSRQINAGCYIFRRKVIERIPAGEVVSVERQTFPQLLLEPRCRIVGYSEQAYWIDVGTPQALCRASADLVLGRATSPAYRRLEASFWAGPGARIASDAVVSEGSAIGNGAIVGEGAEVRGSVVFDAAVIGAGARITRSAIGTGARVGSRAVLEECAIGDGTVVPDDERPAPGTRLSAPSS
jgi:mannose-1-phosphate guanylyltransferase